MLTAEIIFAFLSAVMALAFDLVPGLKDRWEALPKETKAWGWLLACTGVPIFLWGLACKLGVVLFGFTWVCDANGFVDAILLGFAAYGLSQASHFVAKLTGKAY